MRYRCCLFHEIFRLNIGTGLTACICVLEVSILPLSAIFLVDFRAVVTVVFFSFSLFYTVS
jgi:hypothetical protein